MTLRALGPAPAHELFRLVATEGKVAGLGLCVRLDPGEQILGPVADVAAKTHGRRAVAAATRAPRAQGGDRHAENRCRLLRGEQVVGRGIDDAIQRALTCLNERCHASQVRGSRQRSIARPRSARANVVTKW